MIRALLSVTAHSGQALHFTIFSVSVNICPSNEAWSTGNMKRMRYKVASVATKKRKGKSKLRCAILTGHQHRALLTAA